ncbi:adenosylcobalamin-dependent ribonucleoside-diphosphate reductase [Candidatus Woesearchaeota archaeon]|nr:adenosylcobalamin-dependent ribonucleoside-diphosphate reductase [Candidatus Woesearchaeota archaeon]
MISKIKKRDGKIVYFDQEKITRAIFNAAQAVGGKDMKTAQKLSNKVIEKLQKNFKKDVPAVEQIQDLVEKLLIEEGHAKTAKAYIIYRGKRTELREQKQHVLEKDEIDDIDKNFDVNALKVLKSRYLRKSEDGHLTETPKELFTRVTVHVVIPSLFYDQELLNIDSDSRVFEDVTFDYVKNENKYSIGKYKLNKYHLEALKRLYTRFNKNKQIRISWSDLLARLKNGYFNQYEEQITDFFNMLTTKRFMANTPAIANFGNPLGMGSACFVMDVKDSIDEIMETLKQTAIVFKAGGGMGYNFSKLRKEGDFVSSTGGVASGPISFMRLFDTMTEVIKQGGIRRGANMGILNSDHPDIEKFVTAKEGNKGLTNFNISVLIQPDFWDYYENNKPYPLRNPRDKKIIKTINPRALFDKIVYQAWESAEPGIIFSDKINEYNPFFKHLGPIETTNPCGEVLLYPFESCNLGSINVWKFAKEDENGTYYDWDELAKTIRMATRFLDNVIEVNKFPLQQIENMALATRKIGLGVMGVGDLLYELKIKYNSEKGFKFMEKLMEFINYNSKVESVILAKERGSLPYYNKSFFPEGKLPIAGFYDKKSWHMDWETVSNDIKKYGIRNSFTTVIAPTGSISMITGCSSGMEPVYSLAFEKNVKVGSFYYTNHVFEKVMRKRGLFSDKLAEDVVAHGGRLENINYIPRDVKDVFVTAMDIEPLDHIRALAAFQKWVDSSISKTNNFPVDATVDDMRKSYILAHKLGCKSVTVFRDSSIKDQVLVAGEQRKSKEIKIKVTSEGSSMQSKTKPTTCPECATKLDVKEGCVTCPSCGWGLCS